MRTPTSLALVGAGVMALAGLSVPAGATAAPAPARAAAPAAPTVPARYLDQEIAWSSCGATGTPDAARLECAKITAPRDWNNANRRIDVEIAVSRLRPATGTPQRVIFSNPGGPGGPGLTLPLLLNERPALRTAELVGFDPRGTGQSTNVTCNGAPGYTMDARDRDEANLKQTAQASRLIGDYCHSRSGALIDYVTTEQTVKDIDLIRALLGYQTIDFVGYSGGTWMGAYYQKYFPQRAGRFVLDSNTDFTAPWRKTFEAQPQAFERRFRQDFATWAATYDQQLALGDTPAKVRRYYERLRAELKAEPLEIDLGFAQLTVDQNTLDGAIISSMYSKTQFQPLAETMVFLRELLDERAAGGQAAVDRHVASEPAAAQKALATRLRTADAMIDRGRPLGTPAAPLAEDAANATFYAVTCNDTLWPRGRAYADRLSSRLGSQYPLVGWRANQNPCYYWDRPSLSLPTPDGAGLTGPTLMIQSQNDPATNASLAEDAAPKYRGARLLRVRNEGDHGVYVGVNQCVDAIADRYLTTGRAPATGTECQGEGIPAPTPPEQPAAKGAGARAGDPLARAAAWARTIDLD